jgi:hypothetical protein
MGPMLPSSGSFSIKLVDNDHHDGLRILHSRPRGWGRKNPRYDSVGVFHAQNLGNPKKLKGLSERGNGPTRGSPDRTRVCLPPWNDGYIPAEKASKLVYKLEERADVRAQQTPHLLVRIFRRNLHLSYCLEVVLK